MANFYTDNPDIGFHLKHLDLSEVICLKEEGFADRDTYDYAARDVEDALDNYDRVLGVLGELAGDRIAPRAPDVDKEGTHFADGKVTYARGIAKAIQELSQADLMGMTLPRKYGGLNFPTPVYSMAIEMISRADASLMTVFGLQDIAETINNFADDETKKKYLPKFCRGKVTGAMVLTEPDAGSDLQAITLRATEDPEAGCWRLNGVKRFISNGNGDVLLVMARSEEGTRDARGISLFLCESGSTVKIRRIEDKLGIKGSPTCELQFVNTPAILVGKRRFGLIKYVMSLMNGARLGIAAQAIGIAQACLAEARDYAASREQFNKAIQEFPAVRDILVQDRVAVEAMRALTYYTGIIVDLAHLLEKRLSSGVVEDKEQLKELKSRLSYYTKAAALLTPVSKLFCTEELQKVATNTIQILGGSGYMKDYNAERYFRDARITNIYEGTSQLQVVAAIGGVKTGVFRALIDELLPKAGASADPHLLEPLQKQLETFEHALEYYRTQPSDYQDLHAREVVEAATRFLISLLLLELSEYSDHKKAVARKFVLDTLNEIPRLTARIESGDRTAIDQFGVIVN